MPLKITPEYRHHVEYEKIVKEYLIDKGFLVGRATYHEVFDEEMKEILMSRCTPTALYLRGRADRVAIHKKLPLEFEFEIKTKMPGTLPDFTAEVIPFAHHLFKANLGVMILYVYFDPFRNLEKGFWVSDRPPIREIIFPNRWRGREKKILEIIINRTFGGKVPVRYTKWRYGSGDPFLIIDYEDVKKLPDWRKLVDSKILEREELYADS